MIPSNAETFSGEEKSLLSKHVTNIDKDIYCIKNLPEEVIAVLFAYVSRSPLSFRRNLINLIGSGDLDVHEVKDIYSDDAKGIEGAKEKAQKFHDKWVVGYGHSSVAEHADLKFAVENVSIIATKVLEDNRLGRYTEKSSRYQIFDFNHFYKDPVIMDSEFRQDFLDLMGSLFAFYQELIPVMTEHIKRKNPKPDDMKDRPYEASVKAKVCDILRYILPASSYSMLGMSFNARVASRAITKFLSHPLSEIRDIGRRMLEEGRKICPTLLEFALFNKYIDETNRSMMSLSDDIFEGTSPVVGSDVDIVGCDPDPDMRIITAILYEYTNLSYRQIRKYVDKLDQAAKERILDEYMSRMQFFDYPLRALEHAYFTMDIVVDYGAFRDIQRHRMCTQTSQLFNADLGYDVPSEISEIGEEGRFRDLMERSRSLFGRIREKHPHEAQYVVPFAFRKRVLFTWNLRELEHFIRIRSSQQGHISYRRIAIRCHEEIEKRFPLLAKYLRVDKKDYALERIGAELQTEKVLEEAKRKYGKEVRLAQDQR
ncbi:FAD-dependent thymidylate synthase [Candidatus Woesearchaeota archaeon]|nr:FAD-dependent thymidylate synthase [Candidatus Woesearchaeota archaeon]